MKLEQGVINALLEVQTLGLCDGNEHLILLRDGQVILRKTGNDHSVNVTDERDLFKPGDVIVHNHPGCENSLSWQDLRLAHVLDASAIYAVTDSGKVFKASEFLDEEREVYAPYLEQHDVNLELAQHGVMKYEVSKLDELK